MRAYSRWLLTPDFYEEFSDYDFIAIVQLDAVLVRPLPSWVWDVDYTGAPWNPPWRLFASFGQLRLLRVAGRQVGRKLVVGNGGLSVRRVHAMVGAAKRLEQLAAPSLLNQANEDAVWAYYRRKLKLSFAPEHLASTFLDLRDDQPVQPELVTGIHGFKPDMPLALGSFRRWALNAS